MIEQMMGDMRRGLAMARAIQSARSVTLITRSLGGGVRRHGYAVSVERNAPVCVAYDDAIARRFIDLEDDGKVSEPRIEGAERVRCRLVLEVHKEHTHPAVVATGDN